MCPGTINHSFLLSHERAPLYLISARTIRGTREEEREGGRRERENGAKRAVSHRRTNKKVPLCEMLISPTVRLYSHALRSIAVYIFFYRGSDRKIASLMRVLDGIDGTLYNSFRATICKLRAPKHVISTSSGGDRNRQIRIRIRIRIWPPPRNEN